MSAGGEQVTTESHLWRPLSAAVSQMDQVVQQNAALVEQSAAAAENMAAQAQTLVASVARFKLPGAPDIPVVRPVKPVEKKVVSEKPAAPTAEKPATPATRRPKAVKPSMPAPAPLALAAADGDWKEI